MRSLARQRIDRPPASVLSPRSRWQLIEHGKAAISQAVNFVVNLPLKRPTRASVTLAVRDWTDASLFAAKLCTRSVCWVLHGWDV